MGGKERRNFSKTRFPEPTPLAHLMDPKVCFALRLLLSYNGPPTAAGVQVAQCS